MIPDQQEFVRLINEHQPMLHKVCNIYGHSGEDKKDLFQEIVIQLWKAWPQFRGEAGMIRFQQYIERKMKTEMGMI